MDRRILEEAAKRLGATEEAVAERERRPLSRRERLARLLQGILERSAAAGGGEDPYFGPDLGVLLGRQYPEVMREPITRADELDDQRFLQVTQEVIRELASSGSAVIIGRASNLILRDHPTAFHVGVAAPSEERLRRVAEREGVSREEAARLMDAHERARTAFYRKFFKVTPEDPAFLHLLMNTHLLGDKRAVEVIVRAARA